MSYNRILSVASYVALLSVLLSAAPAAAVELSFSLHYIDKNTSWGKSLQQVTLSDLDGDGDLDWTTGNCQSYYGETKNLVWYEYQNADTWVKHTIRSGNSNFPADNQDAASLDVDGDGDNDLVSGSMLFVNNGSGAFASPVVIGTASYDNPSTPAYDPVAINRNHDVAAADINNDGKMDILATSRYNTSTGLYYVAWYEAPANPTSTWTAHTIVNTMPAGFQGMHGSTNPNATGDIDGDGDIDVVTALGWQENVDGSGTSWTAHWDTSVFLGLNGTYQTAVRESVNDLDGDGDLDVVQAECDTTGKVKIAWLENDGSGNFSRHILRSGYYEDYHSLCVADFDNDGDVDIFTAAGPLSSGTTQRDMFIFLNTAGENNTPVYETHNINEYLSASDASALATALGDDHVHEAAFGDVDGDGKIDLILKGWGQIYGSSCSNPADFIYLKNITITPEPASIVLLGIAAVCGSVMYLRRRRNKVS